MSLTHERPSWRKSKPICSRPSATGGVGHIQRERGQAIVRPLDTYPRAVLGIALANLKRPKLSGSKRHKQIPSRLSSRKVRTRIGAHRRSGGGKVGECPTVMKNNRRQPCGPNSHFAGGQAASCCSLAPCQPRLAPFIFRPFRRNKCLLLHLILFLRDLSSVDASPRSASSIEARSVPTLLGLRGLSSIEAPPS
jgi:hypothetical protein